MITSEQDYLKFLHQIQNPNRPTQIIPLPSFIDANTEIQPGYEPMYYINLNDRTIQAPDYLSVEYDHNAETIYFSVDRFYDNIDLSTMTCIIQYQNANPDTIKGGYLYLVPYIDIYTLAKDNMMIIPWVIEGPATQFAGDVTFAIKFYKTSVHPEDDKSYVYNYVLNTVPSKSKVLHGLNIEATTENYYFTASEVANINNRISNIEQKLNEEEIGVLYWTVLEDIPEVVNIEPNYPDDTVNKNNIITDLIMW